MIKGKIYIHKVDDNIWELNVLPEDGRGVLSASIVKFTDGVFGDTKSQFRVDGYKKVDSFFSVLDTLSSGIENFQTAKSIAIRHLKNRLKEDDK